MARSLDGAIDLGAGAGVVHGDAIALDLDGDVVGEGSSQPVCLGKE